MNNDSEGPGLSYEIVQEQAICISIVADPSNNMLNKHVTNECPTISSFHVQTVHSTLGSPHGNDTAINIQLLYDLNTPIESNLWDKNFHSISLYGSMEHLALDSKSIKDSSLHCSSCFLLSNSNFNTNCFLAKYISNK